jgi:hypothetical protein
MAVGIYNNVKIKNFKKLNLYLAKVEQLKKVEILKSNNGK